MGETPQRFFDHARAPLCALDHGPLRGLRHRTVIDRLTGSEALALWQEEHRAGFQVPPHRHDCEEIIAVIEGAIVAEIEGDSFRVERNQSILIPAGALHGFRVTRSGAVRLLALFASSAPKIFRADGVESTPPWEGGRSDHLEGGSDVKDG